MTKLPENLTKPEVANFKPEDTLVIQHLLHLFQSIQVTGNLLKDWTNGILTVLFKNKGERTDLKNYRPLSLINVDYKIYIEILMQRLVRSLDEVIGDYQYAFLPNRLIDDNVRAIQAIMSMYSTRYNVQGEPLAPTRQGGCYILFLD